MNQTAFLRGLLVISLASGAATAWANYQLRKTMDLQRELIDKQREAITACANTPPATSGFVGPGNPFAGGAPGAGTTGEGARFETTTSGAGIRLTGGCFKSVKCTEKGAIVGAARDCFVPVSCDQWH